MASKCEALDDPDENSVLVDSFRASFQRWSRPAYKRTAQSGQSMEPTTENAALANSFRSAFNTWVPPTLSGLTVSVKKTIHSDRATQSNIQVTSSAKSVCHAESRAKQATPERADDVSESNLGERIDKISLGTHAKSTFSDNVSTACNETVNGDVTAPPVHPVLSSGQCQQSQSSPIPVKAEEEVLTKEEEASPELRAELKAIQESVRNGNWWIERAKERRQLRSGSPGDVMKPNGTDMNSNNYVVERNGVPATSYVDRFPDGMSAEEKHHMQYIVYRESARAYPRFRQGERFLAPVTTTDIAAFETVPSRPERGQMLQLLSSARKRWNSGYRDRDNRGANWSHFSATYGEGRIKSAEWFWAWLDQNIEEAWIVDIYHEPFFDGTAHADGMKGLYIAVDLLTDVAPFPKNESPAHEHV